jgi:hypothetical protein
MTEHETRDFSTSEAVEVERRRLQGLFDAGEIRRDEYLRLIMAAVRQWKISNYPRRRWKMKTVPAVAPAPAAVPWSVEGRIAELNAEISEVSAQLADVDARRRDFNRQHTVFLVGTGVCLHAPDVTGRAALVQQLDGFRIERSALHARITALLQELAALKTK